MRMLIDKKKCTGCRMCQLVCSVTKYGEFNIHKAHCFVEEGEFLPNPAVFCLQCKRPLCAEACKFDAFVETELSGVLAIDLKKCVKCGACAEACKFDCIRVDGQSGFPLKCDLCKGKALCIVQCPFKALEVK